MMHRELSSLASCHWGIRVPAIRRELRPPRSSAYLEFEVAINAKTKTSNQSLNVKEIVFRTLLAYNGNIKNMTIR